MSDKKYFNLLPEIYQTPVNRALYDSTYDSVFSSKESEKIDGFIGRRDSGYYDAYNDFYKPEVNKDRTWYQLEPIALTQNPDTLANQDEVFYENFINYLNFLSGKVDNHDRIFSGDFYSFAPPIDCDKFINNQSYKWVSNLPVIDIPNVMDHQIKTDIIGKTHYTFNNGDLTFEATSGIKVIFSDSVAYNKVYTVEGVGKSIFLVEEITFPDEFYVTPEYVTIERGARDCNAWSRTNKWYHSDVIDLVKTLTVVEFDTQHAKRPIIEFTKDIELFKFGTIFRSMIDYAVTEKFSDIENYDISSFGNYVLSNTPSKMDIGVELQEDDLIIFTDTTDTYTFPKSETYEATTFPFKFSLTAPLSDSDDMTIDVSRAMNVIFVVSNGGYAGRPTIEISSAHLWPINLDVGQTLVISDTVSNNFTYQVFARETDKIISLAPTINIVAETCSATVTFMDMNAWYSVDDEINVISFKADSENSIWGVSSDNIDGIMEGDMVQVSFAADQVIPVSKYIWKVTYRTIDSNTSLKLLPYKIKSDIVNVGDIVIDYTLDMGALYYVFDGVSWSSSKDKVQKKEKSFQPPLFNLYHTNLKDGQARSLSDFNGTFNGSKIFSYKISDNTKVLDKYLGVPLEYKDLGQVADIVFTHDLMTERYDYVSDGILTEINGYYYFKQYDYADSYSVVYNTTWLESKVKSVQRVVDRHVISLPIETLSSNFGISSYYPTSHSATIGVDTLIGVDTVTVTYGPYSLLTTDYEIDQSGSSFTITANYSISPIFTVTQVAGAITNVAITYGGLYNKVGDEITIINKAGNGASVKITTVDSIGAITGIDILNGGNNYDNDVVATVYRNFVITYTVGDIFPISVMPTFKDGKPLVSGILEGVNLINGENFNLVYYNGEAIKAIQLVHPVNGGDDLHFFTTSNEALPIDADGYYEIPQQLEANALNNEVYEYTSNEMTRHFLSKIMSQDSFSGDELSLNNYRDTKKDISLGGEILQNVSPVLKGMYASVDGATNLIDSIRFSKNEYTRYKDKIIKLAEQLYRENFRNDANNIVYIDAVVKEIVTRLSNNIFYNEAFKHSYMFAQGEFYVEQYFTINDVVSNVITITEVEDIDLSIPSNVMYLYYGNLNNDTFIPDGGVCALNGIDYEIINYNPIQVKLINYYGEDIVVRIYKEPIPDYMPSTPSKIGLHDVWTPTLKLDDTYADNTYVIIGHDGSKTATYYAKEKMVVEETSIDGSTPNYIADTIVIESHGMKTGDPIIFEYYGDIELTSLPAGQVFYIVKVDYRSFYIRASYESAINGTGTNESLVYSGTGTFKIHKMHISDYVLLEIERRIYCNVVDKFKNDYELFLNKAKITSSYFNEMVYSNQEFNEVIKPKFMKWKSDNNVNYTDNTACDVNNWKTWNYVSDDVNLCGSWKAIYRYVYNTLSPQDSPWEMLGFYQKPIWWDNYYLSWGGVSVITVATGSGYVVGDRLSFIDAEHLSTFDVKVTAIDGFGGITSVAIYKNGEYITTPLPSTGPVTLINNDGAGNGATFTITWDNINTNYSSDNTRMWEDLELGLVRDGNRKGINAEYMRTGLSAIIPVDSGGALRSPHDVGLVDIPVVKDDYWVFGQCGPSEEAWRNSSSYVYDLMETLYTLKPADFGELFWEPSKIVRAEINEKQLIDKDQLIRKGNKDLTVHSETDAEGGIIVHDGYQRFVSDYLGFGGSDVKSIYGDVIRSLNVKLAHKYGGFTDGDTFDLFTESVDPNSRNVGLIIPKENINIKLFKGRHYREAVYSGVVVRIDSRGYQVSGYDFVSNEFKYYGRKTNATTTNIKVGGKSASFSYFKVGTFYTIDQIIKYNDSFYSALVDHTADKFTASNWKRLTELPQVGGTTVTYTKTKNDDLIVIDYGHIFNTLQEVFDFLIGHGDYLEEQGWSFDYYNDTTNESKSWLASAKDFIFWTQSNWGKDNTVFLNPVAEKLSLTLKHGYPDSLLNENTNGVYAIVSQYGFEVPLGDVYVDRNDKVITVESMNQTVGINGLRIPVVEYEHIMVLDNVTIFNDLIYETTLRSRQHKLRLSGYRTTGWYGKYEAPGYLIQNNKTMQNTENLVETIRDIYNSEMPLDNNQMEEAAKHLIGYESKTYLDELQVSGDTQYKFYQGMLKQKGSSQALSKLLRSDYINGNSDITVYEEWAFKLSNFGATENNTTMEFLLDGSEIKSDPQMVNLLYPFSDVSTSYIKRVQVLNAEYVYKAKPTLSISPELSDKDGNYIGSILEAILDSNGCISEIVIVKSASGYTTKPVITANVVGKDSAGNNTLTPTSDVFECVMNRKISDDYKNDDVITIDIDDQDRWLVKPNNTRFDYIVPKTKNISYKLPNAGYVHKSDVDFMAYNEKSLYGMIDLMGTPSNGQYIWMADAINFGLSWCVFIVSPNKTYTTVDDEGNVVNVLFDVTDNDLEGYIIIDGNLYTYVEADGVAFQFFDGDDVDVTTDVLAMTQVSIFKVVRYNSYDDYATIKNGPRGWVDNELNKWVVYDTDINGNVHALRQQEDLVDTSLFSKSYLYDMNTENTIADVSAYDPFKGIIAGVADRNITFKSDIDPARYTHASSSWLENDDMAFTDSKVGQVWWDLSACKFLYYEQGDVRYRRDNWGSLFSGSSVDVYEWTKSSTTPANYVGDGDVKNTTDYVSRKEYNNIYGNYDDVYYFWVKNKKTTPSNMQNRTMSVSSVASYISNPSAYGYQWFSFIDDSNFIFSNLNQSIKNSKCVFQFNYNSVNDNKNKHAEWKLIREGDANNTPTIGLWNKMVDSLCEQDINGRVVPDTRLSSRERLGNKNKPIQTWFNDVYEARRCASQSINDVLIKVNLKDFNVNWESTIVTNIYWKWVDWYEEGYSDVDMTPKKQVISLNISEDLTGMSDGDFIKEYKKNDSTWYEVVSVESSIVKVVRREKSAVQLKPTIYTDKNKNSLRVELRSILTALKQFVFQGTYKYGINKLFFSMVNYVMSEQKHIDWAFKSTYISVNHSGQQLSQPRSFRPNTINSFLAYLNEVKPYSTKLREYNLKLASPIEIANMRAYDFDSLSYTTPSVADQEGGAPSSTIVMGPAYTPTDVPRVFNVTSSYDSIQCGFQERRIYMPVPYTVDGVSTNEETKLTIEGLDTLIFDYVKVIHTVAANGHILPPDFYTALINDDGKLVLTFTNGVPTPNVSITIVSGLYITHTALEEARLFNSAVKNEYTVDDIISYNAGIEVAEIPYTGNDESIIAYNISVDVYGVPLSGFGVPQYGTNPYGVGGYRVIDDVTVVPTFKLVVGAAKRLLEMNSNIKQTIHSFAYNKLPAYSQYCEVTVNVGGSERQALGDYQAEYENQYECDFQGQIIDAQDFPYIFTQSWDTEAWDAYGWDRELSVATTVNPYALEGGIEYFDYESYITFELGDTWSSYVIDGVRDVVEVVIVEDNNGIITETLMIAGTDYTYVYSGFNSIYYTTVSINTTVNAYTPIYPNYTVKVRVTYRPSFMFLIGNIDPTPPYEFHIPYSLADMKLINITDNIVSSATFQDFDDWTSSYSDPVTSIIATVQPQGSIVGTRIAYMVVSYDHNSSNVFDNGEMFDTFDGGYLAPETFDDHMPDELAFYNVSESVVINVNTNCGEKSIEYISDGIVTSYTLPVQLKDGMGSVVVSINGTPLLEGIDYTLSVILPDVSTPAQYGLVLNSVPTLNDVILVNYKNNVYSLIYNADDASHLNAPSISSIFIGGQPFDVTINGNGIDVAPNDVPFANYNSYYVVPTLEPLTNPSSIRVSELHDTLTGVTDITTLASGAYTIKSMATHINDLVAYYAPSATTQNIKDSIISRYKDYIDGFFNTDNYDTIINNFSVVVLPYEHVAPIEEFTVEATASSTVSSGAIDGINLIINGSGYTYTPEVTITGGGGSGAVAVAVMNAGSVASISIIDGGTGYVTPPTITLNAQLVHDHVGRSGDRVLIEYSMPEISYTVHYEELGDVTYTRNSTSYSSVLYANFAMSDTILKVSKLLNSFTPDATIYDVGILWVGNERITYTTVVEYMDHWELSGIMRGTNGTSPPLGSIKYPDGIYPISHTVFDGAITQQVPNGDNWRWVNNDGGLSMSTTEQALFLLAAKGCKEDF